MKQPPDAPENQTRLAALVAAHLDLVYAAALRQVRDPHHAEDITQSVFLLAATKAPHVPPERMGGWLIIATRHVTLAALRADRRRRKHERPRHPAPIFLH